MAGMNINEWSGHRKKDKKKSTRNAQPHNFLCLFTPRVTDVNGREQRKCGCSVLVLLHDCGQKKWNYVSDNFYFFASHHVGEVTRDTVSPLRSLRLQRATEWDTKCTEWNFFSFSSFPWGHSYSSLYIHFVASGEKEKE